MSTTLPHGIIQINEGNIAWYGDITANWQLIDSKIGEYDDAVASIPAPANTGTLTINYGGTTIAMFGADDAGDVSADIPAPGDGTLTVTYGGSTLGSFSANQATPETIDIPAPGDGTLTIQLNGTDVQTFTANQAENVTANIKTPPVNDGTITVTYGGSTLGTFSANQSANGTISIPTPGAGVLTVTVDGVTVGTFSANQETNETINIVVPDALPIGSYIQLAGSQAPAGFLVCNGGAISRTTYSKLFAVIGTTYGSGDGSTTFNLPNLTDRFLQGSTTSGTVKNAGLPNITGFGVPRVKASTETAGETLGFDSYDGSLYALFPDYPTVPLISSPGSYRGQGGIAFDASRSNSIYGNSATVQPNAITCLICIKY